MYKKFRRGLLIGFFILIVLWPIYHLNIFSRIENWSYDLRQYLTLSDKMEDIIIIGIDDPSVDELGRWPWDRRIFAEAMDNLLLADPKVVGIDVLFTEGSSERSQDQALHNAIENKNVVLAGYVSKQNDRLDSVSPFYLKPINLFTNPNGHINVILDNDGVLRRFTTDIILTGESIPSFDMQVLKYGDIQIPKVRGISNNDSLYFRYSKEPNTIPQISFWKIYKNQFNPEDIKDKIVLIGSMTAGIQDQYFTPVGGPMFGVEYHAQVINALMKGQTLIPFTSSGAIITLFGVLSSIIFSFIGWLAGLIVVFLIVVIYLIYAIYQFDSYLTIWPITYPIMILLASYLLNMGLEIWEAQREKRDTAKLLSRYVSPEVAKKLIKGGQALDLGGTRRSITVLFLDIRGFTSISEEKPPEEVVGILNSFFKTVNKVIFDYGGTLDKYMGDSVMAVFNAPLDMKDHEEQAVHAAVEIQKNIAAQGSEYQKTYGIEIKAGIGINSGDAVVGNIGTEERSDYTVIGDAVNIAARLEAKAEKDEILIGLAIKEKLSSHINVISKGLISLDGKKEPVEVYRVEWDSGGVKA